MSDYLSIDSSRSSPLPSPSPSILNQSDLGVQSMSSSPLLAEIERTSPKKFLETKGRFENRRKAEYELSLTAEFVKRGGSPDIKEKLKALTMEQLKSFESALNHDFPVKKLYQNPILAIQSFERAKSYLPTFIALMGHQVPLSTLKEITKELALSAFNPTIDCNELYQTLDRFLQQALDIQNRRPEVLLMIDRATSQDVQDFCATLNEVVALAGPLDPTFLMGAVQDIRDRTVMISDHALEEAIEGSAGGATHLGRTAQHLTARIPNAPWGLCEEQHPAKLVANAAGIVDFDRHPLEIEIPISEPETLETRTIRMTLPLRGRMPQEQASELLEQLGTEARQGMDEQSSETAAALRQAKTDMAKAVYDFNGTVTRPRGQFALEHPYFAEFLAHPLSVQHACRAASLGHVFALSDEGLSLLPRETREYVPVAIHQFLPRDLEALRTVVLAGAGRLEITHPKLSATNQFDIPTTCPITISTHREVRNGAPYLNLIINIDGVERQTSYPLYPGAVYRPGATEEISFQEKLEELASSQLIERDFLLAKAKHLHLKVIPHIL
ncbi:MAG: hypothetical protein JSS62_01555 [Verrucomicrobia bacterium]|nr:hypothetical protein [Verrucomicrobiota bacterium]MBS0646974.1 hypothetical protein [Verrucomicrobiota bacterium]